MKPSELLDKPEKWTKGETARRADGKRAFSMDDGAVCWCIHGAISSCMAWGGGFDQTRHLLNETIKRLFPERVEAINRIEGTTGVFFHAAFNDHPETTFEDVRRVLIEAGL